MRKRLWYPTVQDVINTNKIMVRDFRATKAEKAEVLNRKQIEQALLATKRQKGSVQDKAATLVRRLEHHPFGSANRRTAYATMNQFLWKNEGYALYKKKASGKKFMKDLREGKLTHEQIKRIIKK